MNIRSKINNMLWIAFACIATFILLSAVWIRRTYGVLAMAMVNESFRNGLANKRTLFAKYVILPTIIVFVVLFAVHKVLKKLNRRIVTRITAIFMVLSICAAAVGLDAGFYLSRLWRMSRGQWYDMDHLVIHALGRIDNVTYTNSKEALEKSCQNGRRLLECDLIMTSDGQIAACHDWDFWNQQSYEKGFEDMDYIPTLEVFMNTKVMGKYTPLSGKDIVLFLKDHPDTYIITDTKNAEPDVVAEQFQALVDVAVENDCEETLDRFVVQIYHPYMHDIIENIYSFPNYIYTLYGEGYRGEEDKMMEYAEFCMFRNIDVITMNAMYYHDELLDICNLYGVRMFVHTVNDQDEIQNFYEKGMGVYTDNS